MVSSVFIALPLGGFRAFLVRRRATAGGFGRLEAWVHKYGALSASVL
jgi:hypothetical protein